MHWMSFAAFWVMVGAIVAVNLLAGHIFARHPAMLLCQTAALFLMLAARFTFGLRSFHAAATATEGGLVSKGPYRYWRHPIYASVIYFALADAIDHFTIPIAMLSCVIIAGGIARMVIEERMLVVRYPEYRAYMARTKRLIPFVI